MNQNMNLSSGI